MIFSLVGLIILFFIIFPTHTVTSNNDWNKEDTSQEQEVEVDSTTAYSRNVESKHPDENKNDLSETWEMELDLNNDGRSEKILIKSYPSFSGNQNTKVYVNNSKKPFMSEIGYFHNLTTHQINKSNHIIQLQLLTGQSINALFYTYRQEKFIRVPISTEKPPNYYGIISRNYPELKDIDGDGTLELLAYYSFLYDPARRVEKYKFTGTSFELQETYEEKV